MTPLKSIDLNRPRYRWLSGLVSTGYLVGSVACGWCAADVLLMGLRTTGASGVLLCGMAGVYAVAAAVNVSGALAGLPREDRV